MKFIPVKDPVSIVKRITFFKITLVRLILESYRESYHREKKGYLIALQSLEGEILKTHIIGHAHGNNYIAKDAPNIPHLQVMSLDNLEQTCVVAHTAAVHHSKVVNLGPTSKVWYFFRPGLIPVAIPPPS